MKNLFSLILLLYLVNGCTSSDENPKNDPKLIVKIEVDPEQVRLGNAGTAADIPSGHAGQNPVFHQIAAHYLELVPSANTFLGEGEILYHAAETEAGGEKAIDFSQSKLVAPGETFLEIPLKSIQSGTYEWVRMSLSYQNFDVTFYYNDQPFTGTIASFVGFNTYIDKYLLKTEEVEVKANRKQGYWGLETLAGVVTGQSPEGATTVPNPLFETSPIPQGSCVVTGEFDMPLEITGNETSDIIISMSLSINKSFEWVDENNNGLWDVGNGQAEAVVDMGLRGLVPKVIE
ncbi:hypothetical protein [Echinicola sp. 20G]|uniref:hypothetical protein n=1 Tax=Echinicola sp. 20G TaxID=2781961 RepID=UPI001910D945|nr:hypothetical protein [Echinicola sp. 20G]